MLTVPAEILVPRSLAHSRAIDSQALTPPDNFCAERNVTLRHVHILSMGRSAYFVGLTNMYTSGLSLESRSCRTSGVLWHGRFYKWHNSNDK
jgi:hypothetical protein